MTLGRGKLALLVLTAVAVQPAFAGSKRLARNMKAVPIGSPTEWFSPDDYPPEAIRSVRQGRVIVAVGVDSAGKVVSCQVEQSSGTTALDNRTCELALAKGLFNPATDRKGLPVASVYLLPVRWELPQDADEVPAVDAAQAAAFDVDAEVELAVDADGKLISCRVIQAKLPKDSHDDPCQADKLGGQVGPPWKRGERRVGAKLIRHFSQKYVVEP